MTAMKNEVVDGFRAAAIAGLAVCSPLAPADSEPLLAPLRGFGDVLGEHIGAMPYAAWHNIDPDA